MLININISDMSLQCIFEDLRFPQDITKLIIQYDILTTWLHNIDNIIKRQYQ